MNIQESIKIKIISVLKKDDRIWNKEKTELNQTLLFDLLDKIDEKIIDLLLREKTLRDKFFVKIRDVYVFKTNDFKFFMEENKIDNSFTQYKNRIGLTDGKRFLKDTNDVVLDFPYKDCVLEGGQSTEEGTDTYFEYSEKENKYEEKQAKRKEIFYNQILAQDEIDRLFDPKAFVNWKRYTKDGEQPLRHSRESGNLLLSRDENGTIKENLIIKGNNLLALHSLKKQFAGKIKLIYIDPPYNRGGNADTFIYNNRFKHSTWLTFTKNRLEIAKKLLKDDGIIIVAIDGNEQAYLGVILDEYFPEYEIHCIIIIHNPGGNQGTNFSYTHEYAIFIIPKGKKLIGLQDRTDKPDIRPLRDVSTGNHLRTDAKNCFYPIFIKEGKVVGFGDVSPDNFHPNSANIKKQNGVIEVYPIDPSGNERKWVFARQTVESIKDDLVVEYNKKRMIYDIVRHKTKFTYKTVWTDKKYDSNEHGSKLLKKLVPNNKFTFPKSIHNVYDCINAVVSDDKNAIILDYHAGSGTTAHATLLINQKDKGNRKFILVEQMDYINSVTVPRVQKVMEKENIEDSYIYFELAKWNEKAKEEILACSSLEELEKLFDTLYEKYFLNYNLKIKEFKEKVSKEENFRNLSLEEQKKMFLAMLDLNQMYVNKTEMADKKYGIGKEDQKLTEEFYKE